MAVRARAGADILTGFPVAPGGRAAGLDPSSCSLPTAGPWGLNGKRSGRIYFLFAPRHPRPRKFDGRELARDAKEGRILNPVFLPLPATADSMGLLGRGGRAMKLGGILPPAPALAPSSTGGGGEVEGAVGAQQNSWWLRRAVGGGEWGLALAGKLISFGCCSPRNQGCMLSGRRQQQDSGQT